MEILKSVFGTKNQRVLKRKLRIVDQINDLSDQFASKTDEELKEYRSTHLKMAKDAGANRLLLAESFALVREACSRTLGMRHFDVQLIGGLVLEAGKIAEMRTGEGKTLVAVLTAYYESLFHKVHVVTVNDYLAERDYTLLAPLYEFLGVKASFVVNSTNGEGRKSAYQSDVLYATAHELGFDYLRDNLAMHINEQVQQQRGCAIIDEVDSVLIDEARTPLVISGQASNDAESYHLVRELAETFEIMNQTTYDELKKAQGGEPNVSAHAVVDYKNRGVMITDGGFEAAEKFFSSIAIARSEGELYKREQLYWLHLLRVMLTAMHLYKRDHQYIVSPEGEVKIIDENTGRIMEGRRWNEGIHQAVEVLEGVDVKPESVSLASISIQNYFKMYNQLCGMTGTADTEAVELNSTYGLDVVVIPTHRPVLRQDERDRLFLNESSKIKYLINDVLDCHERGQPVLIGTESVNMSERISKALDDEGISHNVLNAKNHMREALIVAQAGRPRAITISTNMAGRGTDIVLGGNPEVLIQQLSFVTDEEIQAVRDKCKVDQALVRDAGGLRVIGTTRHSSRRVDNQLIGRSGRQGDPGSSVFYISLDDELLQNFVSPVQKRIIEKAGLTEDEAISGNMIDRVVRSAQGTIENIFYEIRSSMIKYDNVLNSQRKVIYTMRNEALHAEDFLSVTEEAISEYTDHLIETYSHGLSDPTMWDTDSMNKDVLESLGIEVKFSLKSDGNPLTKLEATDLLRVSFLSITRHHIDIFGREYMNALSRNIFISMIDKNWLEHMQLLASLRDGIHLQGYAQKNPIQVYNEQAFNLFMNMVKGTNREFIMTLFLTTKSMIENKMETQEEMSA